MRTSAAVGLALVLACGADETPPRSVDAEALPAAGASTIPAPAPASLRASVVLEPPRVEIGDLFTVELAVVTPPGHRVAPAQVPKAIPGVAIVEALRPSIDQEPGRWVHHQRFRARARATGPLLWPAIELSVEAPDGTRLAVVAPERPFEVVSLLAEHPERRSPFSSFRSPHLEARSRGPWLPALIGSLATLAALGLITGVRRARRPVPSASAADAAPGGVAAAAVLAALEHAESEAGDPVRAADLAGVALRRWAAERFRAPRLRTATTEELMREPPPFLLTTRHAAFVAALAAFDALRFPPRHERSEAELHAALRRARELIASTTEPAR